MYEGLWACVSVLRRIRTIGENMTNRKHLSGCCLLICPPGTQLSADTDRIYNMTCMLFHTVSECCGAFFSFVNLNLVQEELYPQSHAHFINSFILITKWLIKISSVLLFKTFYLLNTRKMTYNLKTSVSRFFVFVIVQLEIIEDDAPILNKNKHKQY